MTKHQRRAVYISLCVLALAFAWIEASGVVYLREIAIRERALQTARYLPNLQVSLIALPATLVALETAREACTLVVLVAVAWIASRATAGRIGAFLLAFGIWDVSYYAALRLISGWPDGFRTWDILFLIPSPWIAPVWAPVTIATLFTIGGTYLFWTADRARRYRRADIAALLLAVALTLGAFFAGSNAVLEHRLPERFPGWAFWSGVILGSAWFASVERREAKARESRSPWIGVRVRTLTEHADASATTRSLPGPDDAFDGSEQEHDVDRVAARYRDAMNRWDSLVSEAGQLGDRLARLANGLSRRPEHLIIGLPDERLQHAGDSDIVPSHPLPTIEHLAALTDSIRAEGARAEKLRARLILLGHAELVEQQNGYFQ